MTGLLTVTSVIMILLTFRLFKKKNFYKVLILLNMIMNKCVKKVRKLHFFKIPSIPEQENLP